MESLFPFNFRRWLVRGGLALGFGISLLVLRALHIKIFLLLFGAYLFFDGTLAINQALKSKGRWITLAEGIGDLLVEVIVFTYPNISLSLLWYAIVAWSLLAGLLRLYYAAQVRDVRFHRYLLALTGLAFGLNVALVGLPWTSPDAIYSRLGLLVILPGILFILTYIPWMDKILTVLHDRHIVVR